MSASASTLLPCRDFPCLPGPIPMPSSGTFAEGRALGRKGCGCGKAVDLPGRRMVASGDPFVVPPPGDLPRALLSLERAVSICQAGDLPVLFPRVATALGASYTLAGRVADAVPLLTQAMDRRWQRT